MKCIFYVMLIILTFALFSTLPIDCAAPNDDVAFDRAQSQAEVTEPVQTDAEETLPTEPETTATSDTEPIETSMQVENIVDEISVATMPSECVETVPQYSEEDLDLLSRLIFAEAGGNWIPDDIQLYVGSVVLNRMNHELYPDTLKDVIYQPYQYGPVLSGGIHNTPTERTIENARYLLENGSVLPDNVIFQSGTVQGNGIYYQYNDEVLGTTIYFCYY